jgi:quinol monooxygenase YgiN
MIVLSVRIRCKKEKVGEVLPYFSTFVIRARSEHGCIQYDLFQGKDDPQTFYFFEKWADHGAFDRHSSQPYLREFHDRFDELMERPNDILFLTQIR